MSIALDSKVYVFSCSGEVKHKTSVDSVSLPSVPLLVPPVPSGGHRVGPQGKTLPQFWRLDGAF